MGNAFENSGNTVIPLHSASGLSAAEHVDNTCDVPGESDFLREAIRLGTESSNALLLEHVMKYLVACDQRVPSGLEQRFAEANTGGARWVDTAISAEDSQRPEQVVLRDKLFRTSKQVATLLEGSGYMCYIAVPMMNEEDNIPLLITSVRSQITDTPVALVAADNNSTDRSVAHVKEMGGNVVHAPKQGIGPARQKALEYIQRHTTVPERTILIQTDADCVMDRLDYISSVATAFQDNPAVMVGVGPGTYAVPFEDGSTIELASARDYAQLLGTTGMAGYIKALGKDPRDYLLEEPYQASPL